MDNTAQSPAFREGRTQEPKLRVVPTAHPSSPHIPSGIRHLDERLGGLDMGGLYLMAGTPGPAKLVAALHFLHTGVELGERVVLLTSAEGPEILHAAQAWGMNLDRSWREGQFRVIGFKDDFEMRVFRTAEPQEVLEELGTLIPEDTSRLAVDPGSMFLQDGAKTVLGKSFLDWARKQPSTFMCTLSVDNSETLPSSAEWLVRTTNGVFQIERGADGLYQIRINRPLLGSMGEDDPITLQLIPGKGLGDPVRSPTRRRADRPAGEAERLLFISLGGSPGSDLENWAEGRFTTEIVGEPLEAVAMLQGGADFGGILVAASRKRVADAVRTCRAIRPLTGAAIVFTSDDKLRSTDRVNLLEAGADDCLSGQVDFRELGTRLNQAVSAGGKPSPGMGMVGAGADVLIGGRVTRKEFGEEVLDRAKDPSLSSFSVVRLSSTALPPADLEEALGKRVRHEEGDLVACTRDGCLILLQGARRGPAQTFLSRFRSDMEKRAGGDPGFRVNLLTHPMDKDQLDVIIGWATTPQASATSPALAGESDDTEA